MCEDKKTALETLEGETVFLALREKRKLLGESRKNHSMSEKQEQHDGLQ